MTKTCSKCKEDKELCLYSKAAKNKDGLNYWCKDCCSIYNKRYGKNNPRERGDYQREYRRVNAKAYKESQAKWRKSNQSYSAEYKKQRRKEDSVFVITEKLRHRLYKVTRGVNKSASTLELLGCSLEKLKSHIESQFTDGMSWSKMGLYGIHIDHIRPCASFDLSDPEQQRQCFHYTNLQPLWAKDNLEKSAKISHH